MSFFYDLNKKLDSIRATPEVTHKQLNEGTATESAFQAAIGKKKYGDEGMKALQKAGRDNASAKTMSNIRNKYDKYDEGMMDTVKTMGKKVASGINKLVGHGSDEDMIKDLQRKSGAPVTGKKPSFADKIDNAKKEVDEMLGDVAAEAMRNALSPKQKKIDMNKNGKLDANDFAMLRKGAKSGSKDEMDEENAFTAHKRPAVNTPKVGSIERGAKHDIKHTATGRMVTRRTDAQGISVGSETDDEGNKKQKQLRRGPPEKNKKPERTTANAYKHKGERKVKEGDVSITDQGEYDQEGDMAKDDIKTIVRHAQALSKVLGDNDNLPEWVQSKLAKIEGMMISIDEYMQNQEDDDGEEEPIAEKAVSKQQQKFMGMAHAMQKGEKIPGASKELKKVAKTMKKKDVEDFAKTKHKGLPDKVKSKKKEEDVEESTTSVGSVATSTAAPKSGSMSFGKGIYDSINRELEQMIAESMSINMSDSTEGGKSLTVTATDEDAVKLAMMLKSAGVGGHDHDMHSGMAEAVDENMPDYPTNQEQAADNFGYAGGLNKPKTDVAGDGQTTIPNTAVHTQDEDALRRMMEMAGIKQAELEPWKETMKEEELDEELEEDFLESIQRMREIAGIQEAKKAVDEEKTEEGNLFTKGLEDDDVKIGDKIPGTNAIKKKDIDESIFALTNQWKAYKG